MRPYYERILSENVSLRGFSEQIDPDRLTWHRDEENRIIIVVEGNGWMFQRDNEIPILMYKLYLFCNSWRVFRMVLISFRL